MDQFPNFVFTASQAQQYEWVKEHYPALYQKIKQWVAEGRFVPTGGTWVEMVRRNTLAPPSHIIPPEGL